MADVKQKLCAKCKSVNDFAAKFCSGCGNQFELKGYKDATWVCEWCYQLNSNDKSRCIRCGYHRTTQESRSSEENKDHKWICEWCGCSNAIGKERCGRCGWCFSNTTGEGGAKQSHDSDNRQNNQSHNKDGHYSDSGKSSSCNSSNARKKKIRTHYDNLKVARDAPIEVVKAAYRALCQKHHPDKTDDPVKRSSAEKILTIINAAYEVLSDANKRKMHDDWIDANENDSA